MTDDDLARVFGIDTALVRRARAVRAVSIHLFVAVWMGLLSLEQAEHIVAATDANSRVHPDAMQE